MSTWHTRWWHSQRWGKAQLAHHCTRAARRSQSEQSRLPTRRSRSVRARVCVLVCWVIVLRKPCDLWKISPQKTVLRCGKTGSRISKAVICLPFLLLPRFVAWFTPLNCSLSTDLRPRLRSWAGTLAHRASSVRGTICVSVGFYILIITHWGEAAIAVDCSAKEWKYVSF